MMGSGFEALASTLERLGIEEQGEKKAAKEQFSIGYHLGKADAYLLAAKWLRQEIKVDQAHKSDQEGR